ncbi:hypothetical protein BgiBS90_007976 [Biomphalaria glabrata]|nr:hypothetical protein BgiBS90_007976 [Biomphalaria glabrata]
MPFNYTPDVVMSSMDMCHYTSIATDPTLQCPVVTEMSLSPVRTSVAIHHYIFSQHTTTSSMSCGSSEPVCNKPRAHEILKGHKGHLR